MPRVMAMACVFISFVLFGVLATDGVTWPWALLSQWVFPQVLLDTVRAPAVNGEEGIFLLELFDD
jgi:hypothetical protein